MNKELLINQFINNTKNGLTMDNVFFSMDMEKVKNYFLKVADFSVINRELFRIALFC